MYFSSISDSALLISHSRNCLFERLLLAASGIDSDFESDDGSESDSSVGSSCSSYSMASEDTADKEATLEDSKVYLQKMDKRAKSNAGDGGSNTDMTDEIMMNLIEKYKEKRERKKRDLDAAESSSDNKQGGAKKARC